MADTSFTVPKRRRFIGWIILNWLSLGLLGVGVWWDHWYRSGRIEEDTWLYDWLSFYLIASAAFFMLLNFFGPTMLAMVRMSKWRKILENNHLALRKSATIIKNKDVEAKALEDQLSDQASGAETQRDKRLAYLEWISEALGKESSHQVMDLVWKRLEADLPDRQFDYWVYDRGSLTFSRQDQCPQPEIFAHRHKQLTTDQMGEAFKMLELHKVVVYAPSSDSEQFSESLQEYLSVHSACLVPVVRRSELAGMLVAINPNREYWKPSQRIVLHEAATLLTAMLEKTLHSAQATKIWDDRNHMASFLDYLGIPVARLSFKKPILVSGLGENWGEHLTDIDLVWHNNAFDAARLEQDMSWKNCVDESVCSDFEEKHTQTITKDWAGHPYKILLVPGYYKGELTGYWAVFMAATDSDHAPDSSEESAELAFIETLNGLNVQLQNQSLRSSAFEQVALDKSPLLVMTDHQWNVLYASAEASATFGWGVGDRLDFYDQAAVGEDFRHAIPSVSGTEGQYDSRIREIVLHGKTTYLIEITSVSA